MMFGVKILVFTGLCLASVPGMSAERWKVSDVESWDTLNVRSQPGVTSEVIGKIPSDAENIVATGEEQEIGKTVWMEISWEDKPGWVSKAYLTSMPESDPEAESEEKPVTVVGTEPETAPQTKAESEVASDGMTDLEALSILARPAIAETSPEDGQGVSVMPASLQIRKEE